MRQIMRLASAHLVRLRKRVLAWYKADHRDLPWRKTRDPYAIWVSEVMCQQTRVETAIPYYERFLRKFPTPNALAQAKEEEVLKLWEGLGYYSRARNLQAAAKEVTERYGGQVPNSSERLSKLKGIGAYTSAAVASIAFGEPVACVDGNYKRVLSRLFATHERIDPIAQKFIDPGDPSSFNQGIMELGATICTPRNPKCTECPLQKDCRANLAGAVLQFPKRSKAKPVPVVRMVSVVVRSGDKVLLVKRSTEGLWKGMWEFPTFEIFGSESPLLRAKRGLQEEFGVVVKTPRRTANLTHQLSHKTIELTAIRSDVAAPQSQLKGAWLSHAELETKPLSKLQQLVAATIGRE